MVIPHRTEGPLLVRGEGEHVPVFLRMLGVVVVAAAIGGSAWSAARYFDERALIIAPDGIDAPSVSEVALTLAGSSDAACTELTGRSRALADDVEACAAEAIGPRAEIYERLLAAEVWLSGLYVAAAIGCLVGWLFFARQGARSVSAYAFTAVVAGALLDPLENIALRRGLTQLLAGHETSWFTVAAALALAKFALVAAAAVVALFALVVVGSRVVTHRWKLPAGVRDWIVAGTDENVSDDPDLIPPWPHAVDARGVWPQTSASSSSSWRPTPSARWRAASRVPPTRRRGGTGICVSGGGIRSACVTLGALQVLREHGVMREADYLVSVSGGGYMAGALQLALQPGCDPPIVAGSATDAFAPGSVEEDHLRRHGKYIADSAREWFSALLVLLRNLLASLVLLFAVVIVVGMAFNAFYRLIPVPAASQLQDRVEAELTEDAAATATAEDPVDDEQGADATDISFFPAPVSWAVGAPLGVGALLWLAAWLWGRRSLLRAATATTAAAALIAGVVIVVPALGWLSTQVLVVELKLEVPQIASILGGGASVFAYVGALATILWRRKEKIGTAGTWFGRIRSGVQPLEREVATGLTQRLIVWGVLVVLAALFVLLFGFTVVHAHLWRAWGREWTVWVGVIVFALLVVSLDQTALSLHPFYRRRLASAFAVRRHRVDGHDVARPYNFLGERTRLSTYGSNDGRVGAPHIIFGAAAAMSGSERTPPGRRAVSFTFSHDYVGGPDVGWARTRSLEESLKARLSRDLTLQSAMAVSGAAFASSMGSQAQAFQTLLAISNARLGTWLPNPAYLVEMADRSDRWTRPGIPRVRRLAYLLREVFGAYPFDERLLLCTDGGHYENLGLVELLRHGCETIVCIDSSGDTPPFATTLSQAITLAWEELGVRITLEDDRMDLVPGSAEPLEPPDPLATLNARLSKSAVVIGSICYPTPIEVKGGRRITRGLLIAAKTSLTSDMPYPLLSYAVNNTTFPRRSTADQWFDVGQFDAYQELGRYLGSRAARALRAERDGTSTRRPTCEPMAGGDTPACPGRSARLLTTIRSVRRGAAQ